MIDEIFWKNNARHLSETHNNKRHPFGAYSFTQAGMKFLRVSFTNVSFPFGKVTFMDGKKRYPA